MNIHPEGWKVGMDVCVVITLNVRGEPRVSGATITKIGRRWITLDDSTRFDAETRRIDGRGYSSPGTIYASETEYRETSLKQECWMGFRAGLPSTAPAHLTIEDLQKIIALILQYHAEESSE